MLHLFTTVRITFYIERAFKSFKNHKILRLFMLTCPHIFFLCCLHLSFIFLKEKVNFLYKSKKKKLYWMKNSWYRFDAISIYSRVPEKGWFVSCLFLLLFLWSPHNLTYCVCWIWTFKSRPISQKFFQKNTTFLKYQINYSQNSVKLKNI